MAVASLWFNVKSNVMRVKIVTTGESVSVFVPPSHCNTDHQISNLITDTFYFCILLWFEYFSVRIYFDAGRESGCRDQALHILCKWCADWVIECCLMENFIVAPLSNLTWPNFWCEDTWLAFKYTLFKLFFFHINSMKTKEHKGPEKQCECISNVPIWSCISDTFRCILLLN